MDQDHYYVFREARDVDELEALLRLRYSVYQESRMQGFMPQRENGIQIDAYDLHSRHFGLFKNDREPIGYHRPVFETDAPLKAKLEEIAAGYSLESKLAVTPETPFPCMSYWPCKAALVKFYDTAHESNNKMAEATRFSLKEKSLELAKHIIESELAFQVVSNTDFALMVCHYGHLRFYKQYGFELLCDTQAELVYGVKSVCTLIRVTNIPISMREKIYSMSEVFHKHGYVCYNPSEPDCFYAPGAPQGRRIAVYA